MNIINEIAWHSLILFLWSGSGLGVVVGFGLLFAPETLERVNTYLMRWIDTHKIEAELDRPRWMERFVYRHHRLIGGALFCGSVFIIYKFLLRPLRQKFAFFAINDVFGLLDAAIALFVISGVLGAMIGLIMAGKPSLLRELETAANRWISTDKLNEAFNKMHFSLDRIMLRHRKAAGLTLIAVSSYVCYVLGVLLLNGNWVF